MSKEKCKNCKDCKCKDKENKDYSKKDIEIITAVVTITNMVAIEYGAHNEFQNMKKTEKEIAEMKATKANMKKIIKIYDDTLALTKSVTATILAKTHLSENNYDKALSMSYIGLQGLMCFAKEHDEMDFIVKDPSGTKYTIREICGDLQKAFEKVTDTGKILDDLHSYINTVQEYQTEVEEDNGDEND